MPFATKPPRRDTTIRRYAVVVVLVVALLSATLLAVVMLRQYRTLLQRGAQSASAVAALVAEQTTRSLQAVNQALELADARLRTLAAAGRLDEAHARSELRAQLRGLPYVRAIWAMDAQGAIRFDSDVGNIGLSLADREYFQVHMGGQRPEFYVGKPVRSRSVGTWLVSATRPRLDAEGRFAGVIAAAVEPPYFDQLWRVIDVGVGGSIALWTREGVLMMRSPFADAAIGQRFDERQGFSGRILQSSSGSFNAVSPIDGLRRVLAFRQLDEFPNLIVVVGEPHERLLAQWRQTALLAALAWLLSNAAVAALLALGVREWERRRERDERSGQQQKMEAIGTLAGGIAHDFNNILSSILGHASLARSGKTDSAVAEHLAHIEGAGLRARALVQQILAFSRNQPHELAPVALAPLIEETLSLLRATLPAHVELVVLPAAEPVAALADATQLQQVLLNLCTNAWQAFDARGGRIEIGVGERTLDDAAAAALGIPAGRWAHLWVRDNGPGMDEATRRRIFEPFFTTKTKSGGTGLGLAVVHGIVGAHGGALEVESRPGAGTCFHVLLRTAGEARARAAATPQAGPEAASPQAAAAAPVRPADHHLLCVDDDPTVLLTTEALLRHAGFRVTAFASPEEALQALRQAPEAFDLLVSDHEMPRMSGLELTRQALRLRPDLPVLLCSGYVTEALRTDAAAAGAAAVLHKETVYRELPPAVLAPLAARGAPR